MVDDANVNYYVSDLVNYVEAHSNFESPVFITGYAKKNQKLSVFIKVFDLLKVGPIKSMNRILKSLLLRVIKKVERRIVLKKISKFL